MDLTFNGRMEAYYQKFIELQEKLRNSEEERLRLEMKFNEMVQVAKEEEQMHYKKLRAQYKRFLDEDRKRQERNERILRNLERIEARIAMLTSKTERFKMLRRQYHNYLQRISLTKSSETQENPPPPPPRILINKPHASNDVDVVNKALDNAHDEKLKMLDKYLQSLSSQNLEDRTDKARNNLQADMKYLNDISKKLEKGFDSNEANSIAEDIMNSIYSRHYKKEPLNYDMQTTNKSNVISNLGNNSNKKTFSDNRDPVSSTIPDYWAHNFEHISDANNRSYKNGSSIGLARFNNSLTLHEDYNASENIDLTVNDSVNNVNKNIASKKRLDDDNNKNSLTYSSSLCMNECGTENTNVVGEVKIGLQDSLGMVGNVQDVPILGKACDIDNERKSSVNEKNDVAKEKIGSKENMENGGFMLSKSEIDVIENEKDDNKDDVKESEFIGKDNDEIHNDTHEAEENIVDQMLPKSNEMRIVTSNDEYKEGYDQKHKIADPSKPKENMTKEVEDSQIAVLTATPDVAAKDGEVGEKQFAADDTLAQGEYLPQEHEVVTESDQNEDQYNNESSEQVQNNTQSINQNGDILINDENGEQYENVQYNEGNDQTLFYEDSAQPTQQYGEQENNQQYYDDGQTNAYDQQYNENQQAQLYEEHGEVMQEYQNNGQEMIYPYQQQYDENGQPLYQYDESGQLIQQYNENGQPVDMYNQPLQYDGMEQHDDNDAIDAYGETQPPAEGYEHMQQYGTEGQEVQQFDENGQAIYQYDTESGVVPQYDENGELLNPEELVGQANQEFEGSGEQYGENDQQFDEGGEVIPIQDSELLERGENNDELKEGLAEEEKKHGEVIANEEKDMQDNIVEDDDKDHENRKTVLEMLDTDTESLKHSTSKVSNDSDFDFSKS